MMRGGYIKPVGNGIFTLFPVTKRITSKIERILREEMDRIGGQEVLFPVAIPAALWKESGRFESVGSELLRFKDRSGADMVLGMTHEEASVHFVRDVADSYTQYPFMIYQIRRNSATNRAAAATDPRARVHDEGRLLVPHLAGGSGALLHGVLRRLQPHLRARGRARGRGRGVGQRHDGRQGVARVHAAHPRRRGHDCLCRDCGYRANMEAAPCIARGEAGETAALQKVATPGVKTIEDLCEFLKIPATATCKAVVYQENLTDRYVVAFLRGDLDINETKLRNYLKAEIHPADITPESGLAAGFIGPKGLPEGVKVVYDSSLEGVNWFATGANEADFHYTGFNIPREMGEVEYVDVAKAYDGGVCPVCGHKSIYTSRGIEVGNIFQLGTRYTEAMDMTYVDADGSLKHPIMGCYGIGVGRLAAAVCEAHHDDYGPIWPMSIAPWHVHLCSLRADNPEVAETSQRLYDELTKRGVEVIWDDRPVSAGVMFSDADLFGVPVRVVVSPKGLKNGTIEISSRDKSMQEKRPIDEAADFVYNYVCSELAKLECRL